MDPKAVVFAKTLAKAPPIPSAIEVGTEVLYTNDFGATFTQKVIGFASNVQIHTDISTLIPSGERVSAQRQEQRLVYLDTDCYWSPVRFDQLKIMVAK